MPLSSGFGQLQLKFSDVQNLLQQVHWASPQQLSTRNLPMCLAALTWMEAGPQGMKLASLRSLIRWRLLCTWVGSTSPYTTTKNMKWKHESMRIVVGGWNQVPSDIKNARTVGSLKIIELHWWHQPWWRRTRVQAEVWRALDTDTPAVLWLFLWPFIFEKWCKCSFKK